MDSNTVNVLLVEDNEQHAALLRQMVQRSKETVFNLVHVRNLAAALERLETGDINLVLLDLVLPDSEGLATFSALHSKCPDTAVIVLSGLDDESLARQTVQIGAQDYLVKGYVDQHWLVRSMTYAVERKRTQRALEAANESLEQRVAERTTELSRSNTKLQAEIVERQRAEGALLDSNRQLAQALTQVKENHQNAIRQERLQALGRMASSIAHDFNNALAPIIGFSELLLLRPQTPADKVRNYLEMINTAAKDSAKVVSRLREFYRYREEAEVFVPVALNNAMQNVIATSEKKWQATAKALGSRITIKSELAKVPPLPANEAELHELIGNIVLNAVEAIEKDGTITLRTFAQDNRAVIQVTDTGAGMTEDVRARCLEPFYSTKNKHGSGLGLGIVYGIVRRHGGEVEVTSEVGTGTTITITLPIKQEEKQPEKPEKMGAPAKRLRILVVEDEPLVREVITVYLSEDKHQVQTAVNGREGLEKFRAGEFDLVLTDRAMPEMTGDQLAAEIKKLKPRQPVVLLTGYGDLMTGAGERPTGVDLVVSKPFTMNSLRTAIAQGVATAGRPEPASEKPAAAGASSK